MEKQTEGDTEGEHVTCIRQGGDNGPLTQGHPHGECKLSKFTTTAKQTLQAEEFKLKKAWSYTDTDCFYPLIPVKQKRSL